MNYEVVWKGVGPLPYPPGRTQADDERYYLQRLQPAEREPLSERQQKRRAKAQQAEPIGTRKCEQCWHRMIPAGEARKGHARCRVCRKAKPRRGGPLPKANGGLE
jgi:hypothetical protein